MSVFEHQNNNNNKYPFSRFTIPPATTAFLPFYNTDFYISSILKRKNVVDFILNLIHRQPLKCFALFEATCRTLAVLSSSPRVDCPYCGSLDKRTLCSFSGVYQCLYCDMSTSTFPSIVPIVLSILRSHQKNPELELSS